MFLRALVLCFALVFPVSGADATEQTWHVLAERSDLDEAIGIALAHRWQFESVGVFSMDKGEFAAIATPHETANGDVYTLIHPGQAGKFVWRIEDEGIQRYEYRHNDPLTISSGDLDIEMSAPFDPVDHMRKPTLTLFEGGRAVYETSIPESGTDAAFARIRIVWLDRSAHAPQVIFSGYTMGAHCCTVTKILSKGADGWQEIDGGWHDGDEGYRFEDIDDDGEYELISRDDRFLYVFAPYAASWTPVRVYRLAGDALVDVSLEPAYAGHFRREAIALEYHAARRPHLWSEAGFLAGWVALKSILGDYEIAWAKMLASYQDDGFWNHTVCTTVPADDICPDAQMHSASFPEALEDYLRRTGYR